MATIAFDTLKPARRLEAAGFGRDQTAGAAEALAETAVTRDDLDQRLTVTEVNLDQRLAVAEAGLDRRLGVAEAT